MRQLSVNEASGLTLSRVIGVRERWNDGTMELIGLIGPMGRMGGGAHERITGTTAPVSETWAGPLSEASRDRGGRERLCGCIPPETRKRVRRAVFIGPSRLWTRKPIAITG